MTEECWTNATVYVVGVGCCRLSGVTVDNWSSPFVSLRVEVMPPGAALDRLDRLYKLSGDAAVLATAYLRTRDVTPLLLLSDRLQEEPSEAEELDPDTLAKVVLWLRGRYIGPLA